MNCGRVSNQLSAYIDRELTGAEMLQVRRHLDACPACRSEHEGLTRMKLLLGNLPSPEPQPGLVAAAVHRWQHREAPSPRRAEPPDRAWWALVSPVVEWIFGRGAWPAARLPLGLITAAVAAGLILTSVFLHRPRHADALIATSPVFVLEGQDPLNHQMDGEWTAPALPTDDSHWMSGPSSPLPLNWVSVSFSGDSSRSFR